jgi:tetratricopeptide (TPR) repeat protein
VIEIDVSTPMPPSRSEAPASRPPPAVPAPENAEDTANGLRFDDLFHDLGDLPGSSHAMRPVELIEEAEAKAASDLIDAGRYDEAFAAFEEQLRRNPTDRAARAGKELAFGLRLAAAGDRTGAIQHLEAALEIEPWSERVARALNAVRREQTDSRKGLLAKLLGRGN